MEIAEIRCGARIVTISIQEAGTYIGVVPSRVRSYVSRRFVNGGTVVCLRWIQRGGHGQSGNQLTAPPELLRLKQARRVTVAALQSSEQVTTLRTLTNEEEYRHRLAAGRRTRASPSTARMRVAPMECVTARGRHPL